LTPPFSLSGVCRRMSKRKPKGGRRVAQLVAPEFFCAGTALQIVMRGQKEDAIRRDVRYRRSGPTIMVSPS
jgi:hypothetical protein